MCSEASASLVCCFVKITAVKLELLVIKYPQNSAFIEFRRPSLIQTDFLPELVITL